MTWKERTVVRILLLVARMLSEEPWADEIKHLSNHITSGIGEDYARNLRRPVEVSRT